MSGIFVKITPLIVVFALITVTAFANQLWSGCWKWLEGMTGCEPESLLCSAWSDENKDGIGDEFRGVRLILPYVSYEMKLEDVVTFFLVQVIFVKIMDYRKERQDAADLLEQPVELAANRITIGLNTVHGGVLKLRTLSDTETRRVFPNPTQVKELTALCKDMANDEPSFLAAYFLLLGGPRAPRPPRGSRADPFVRANDKSAAERLRRVLNNFLSSMFCIGHVALDMGDVRTQTATFYFALTFETALTAKADRKLRLLLIRKETLQQDLHLGLDMEVPKGSNANSYYQDRLQVLIQLRDLINGPDDPTLVHGTVSLSVPVTRDC